MVTSGGLGLDDKAKVTVQSPRTRMTKTTTMIRSDDEEAEDDKKK